MRSILSELKLTLKSHDELNKNLWTEKGKLDPEVYRALDKIGKEWADFANIPKSAIKDVILTGGNANYNYTKFSDLDLHLVVDKDKIDCQGILDDYLQSKKQLWALTHDITVKGQPVELYAQDYKDPFKEGQGIYSLQSNKWLQEPTKFNINRTHPEVIRKVKDFMAQIDSLIDSNSDDIEVFKRMKARIKMMRSSAIEKGGESAPENLVFKELRNRGYLDKMSKYLRSIEDKKLSLEAYYGGEERRKKDENQKKINTFKKGLLPGKAWQGKYDQFGREHDTNTGELK